MQITVFSFQLFFLKSLKFYVATFNFWKCLATITCEAQLSSQFCPACTRDKTFLSFTAWYIPFNKQFQKLNVATWNFKLLRFFLNRKHCYLQNKYELTVFQKNIKNSVSTRKSEKMLFFYTLSSIKPKLWITESL